MARAWPWPPAAQSIRSRALWPAAVTSSVCITERRSRYGHAAAITTAVTANHAATDADSIRLRRCTVGRFTLTLILVVVGRRRSTLTLRLWALKAIAILSPWPLHAFWREYLHALLCAFPPNLTVPIEIRILQATNAEQMTVSKADKKASKATAAASSSLLPRSGGLPPEATASILSAGGPSTLEATRLVAAGTLWARLPKALLVCTTPSANAAATMAATAAPLGIGGSPAVASSRGSVSHASELHEALWGSDAFWTGSGKSGDRASDGGGGDGERDAALSMTSGRLVHAQRQHTLATLSAAIASVPPPTLCILLSAMLSGWSVLLFSRDPVILSQVCTALLLAFRPLRWHGACLPLIPRTRGGAAMLQKLRAAGHNVPLLLGVLQSPHSPNSPPSTPHAKKTLHVLLPDGRPVWAPGERLPTLPPYFARSIESAILAAAAAVGMPPPVSSRRGGSGIVRPPSTPSASSTCKVFTSGIGFDEAGGAQPFDGASAADLLSRMSTSTPDLTAQDQMSTAFGEVLPSPTKRQSAAGSAQEALSLQVVEEDWVSAAGGHAAEPSAGALVVDALRQAVLGACHVAPVKKSPAEGSGGSSNGGAAADETTVESEAAGLAWLTAMQELTTPVYGSGSGNGGERNAEVIKSVNTLLGGLSSSSHFEEWRIRRRASTLQSSLESEDPSSAEQSRLRADKVTGGGVPEMRADFSLPSQPELDELAKHFGEGTHMLPPADQLTVAMGALQSELQRLLSSVHEWVGHALAEQQDLGWECSLVFSIELAQAAKRLETQHEQIAIGYALCHCKEPSPCERSKAVAAASAGTALAARATSSQRKKSHSPSRLR